MSKRATNGHSTLVLPEVVIDDLRAGVDWLTVTAKAADLRRDLFAECERVKSILDQSGDRPKPWSFKGYQGYAIGGLRWGTRLDGDIAMLSGVDAHQNWYAVGEWCENCSRVDLAVTVNCARAWSGLLQTYYDFLNEPTAKHVKFSSSITKNSAGGQTLYIGSRASRAFGRVYDKGIEAGLEPESGKLWRYEVEFKKPLAKLVLAALHSNKYLPVDCHWSEEVAQSIVSTVYVWFLARNLPPLFTRRENEAISLECEARITSDEVSLNWLTTQVRPTVLRLAERGKLHRVKEALGLTDQIQTYLSQTVE
jgi:hypothetical protein